MGIFSHGKLITVLQYFTDKIDDYWHILYPVISKEKRDSSCYFYLMDISRKALDYKGSFSSEGIYLFHGYDGREHIYALEISIYTLASWQAWIKSNDDIWLKKALLHCTWLIENQYDDGSWKMTHKNPKYYDLPDHWPSALAQGFAISSLVRAYQYTQERTYLESAKRACNFLEKPIDNDGIKREFIFSGVSGWIYEEYPRKELSGVLNGYISAVFGIYELSKYDSGYQELFEKNMKNLQNILSLYDMGYWSYYSLDGTVSSGFYHRLVVKQLEVLSTMSAGYKTYYILFLNYQNSFSKRLKALSIKLWRYR